MPQSPATSLPSPKERRRLREAKSLSHADLAAKLGVTRETVRSWEKGRTNPRGRSHEAYAKLLNALAEECAAAEAPADGADPGAGRHAVRRPGWAQAGDGARSTTRPERPVKRAAKPHGPTGVAGAPPAVSGRSHLRPTPTSTPEATPTSSEAETGVGAEPMPEAGAKGGSGAKAGAGSKAGARTGAGVKGKPAAGAGADLESGAGNAPAPAPPPGPATESAPGVGPADPAPPPTTSAPAQAAEAGKSPEPDPASGAAPASAATAAPASTPGQSTSGQPASERPGATLTPAAALPVRRRDVSAAEAFDALCGHAAPALVRQAYLLTGRRSLAQEAVERAFQQAWQRWPEVAVDRDPPGWVRAVTHEYAMSPWHRFRPGLRRSDAPPAEPADRAFLGVLLRLPPAQRRTLLLYDGVGLDLPETAAETEASTPAAANRLLHARAAIAERLPDLAEPATLHRRLVALGGAEKLRPPKPQRVRVTSERRARLWTRAAIAFTTLIVGATALTLRTAPTHYEPPQAPGRAISGVPPLMGPGPLSYEDEELRAKLRGEVPSGPHRLVPQAK
ncbi:helix-turn-helix domain-containing protein [Streptomyces sp. NPDC023327]|uniref:helix-turn-helix domain-containing protein n=1 Tax=Streptomyces sp. NPDC023327 TaxID=3157088 RepID=UPI0034042460